MHPSSPRGMRQRVAAEAARIIAEQGLVDFEGARRKAVARLRITDRRQWPDNSEIAQALEDYQALFQADERPRTLERLRQTAMRAMDLVADFSPRLVGAVRDGLAGDHSGITLHLTADTAKTVAIHLLNHGVYHDSDELRLRFSDGNTMARPALRFALDGVDILAVIMEPGDRSRPPLDSVSGRPDRGLTRAQVEQLLAAGGGDAGEMT